MMHFIRVHPDHLREAAQILARQGAAVDSLGKELQRAIDGLDTWAWDGYSRARAGPLISRVGPESLHLAEQLEDLGRKLQHAAEEFEQVDTIIASPLTSVFERLSEYVEWGKGLKAALDGVTTILGAAIIAGQVREGTTYAGQVKIYGSQFLKGWAGLNRHLTHIKNANLPQHMAGRALKISPIGVLLEAGSELDENWKEYKGDPVKVGAGIVVDTVIGVGVTTLAMAAGTYAGATIGQVLIPIPGVGAIIGGAVGKLAAQWAVKHFQVDEKIENIRIGGRELDQFLVGTIDAALEPFVNAVASGFR